jgi:hypothetical protein
MVLLFDTENNKYYRFAGYRVPQFGELWLTTTNAILRQTLPITNIQRDILREVPRQTRTGKEIRMTKIIEIKSCMHCPHSSWIEGSTYCMHSDVCFENTGSSYIQDADKQRVNSTGFPEWCPLEDK